MHLPRPRRAPTLQLAFLERARALSLSFSCAVLLLGLLGVAMQFSAGGGDMEPWGNPQLVRFLVGFCLMIAISLAPPGIFLRYAYHAYAGCVLLLLVVEIFGHIGMGAQRWFRIGFINLQPSEITKVCLILALARFYHMIQSEDVNRPLHLLIPLLMIAVPAGLVLIQPNLGTATVMAGTAAGILFTAGLRLWFFIGAVCLVLAAAPIGWQFLHDYQKQRVLTFLNPEADPLGSGYNIMQSKIAIGSGGIGGKGFLEGSQGQLSFLPEKQTDFVFTMLAEEFGLIGGLIVIALYAFLLMFALWTGITSKNHFGRMVAAGVGMLFFCHIFINMAMVMGLIPVVGIPLPLLSYGGSITITALVALGLLHNVYINRDARIARNADPAFL